MQDIKNSYDLFFVDASINEIEKIKAAGKELLLYYNGYNTNSEQKYSTISTAQMAKMWLEKNNTLGAYAYVIGSKEVAKYIVGNRIAEKLDESGFILLIDESERNIEEQFEEIREAIPNSLVLYCVSDADEHHLARKYMAHGGNAMFFGKPWPFVYEYIKYKHPSKKILAIEHTAQGIVGANLNSIDSIFIGGQLKQATYCFNTIDEFIDAKI